MMINKGDQLSDLLSELVSTRADIPKKEEFVRDWYLARAYASEKLTEQLCRVDDSGNTKKPLHITLEGTSSLMCAVVREIILRAHYYDFVEPTANSKKKKNQTVITILCSKGKEDEVEQKLLETPFLGNYLYYCWKEPLEYLDVDVELRAKCNGEEAYITEETVKAFANSHTIEKSIDTHIAQRANSIYLVGKDLENLPDISSTDVGMYEIPLKVFDSNILEENSKKSWNDLSTSDKLSNVFCTDTFLTRKLMLERGTVKYKLSEVGIIEKFILELSRSEHMRWVTEKLIMEFKPWTPRHHYEYSILFGDEKNAYRKLLKNQKLHLDICSYRDLCRLDPANRKYDTFLILTMLHMLEGNK